jgi:multidrug efflux pump subunit AcrA (membrane-fusion protein)
MADEDIVVTIEEGAEPSGGAEVVLVDETGITSGTVAKKPSDDPVATLKSQLAEKQAALETANQQIAGAHTVATQATQRARDAEREANEARTQVAASQRTTVESGIAAAKAEADAAEESYKAAFEAGNAAEMAKAQRRMSRAEADLALLEQAKGDLAEPQQRQTTQRTEAPPQRQTDPIEDFINSRTIPSQNWLRSHRDYLTDERKSLKLTAADADARGEGLKADSPEYFAHVERFLGMKKAAEPEPKPGNGADTPSQRRPTAPVAPVTPSGGGMSGESNTVRLTKAEAEAATDGTHQWNYDDPTGKGRFKKGDAIGIQEMARRKLTMTRQGRYQNANIDGT